MLAIFSQPLLHQSCPSVIRFVAGQKLSTSPSCPRSGELPKPKKQPLLRLYLDPCVDPVAFLPSHPVHCGKKKRKRSPLFFESHVTTAQGTKPFLCRNIFILHLPFLSPSTPFLLRTSPRFLPLSLAMHRTYSMRQSRAPTASQIESPPPPLSTTKSGRWLGKGGIGECHCEIIELSRRRLPDRAATRPPPSHGGTAVAATISGRK